MTSRHYAFVIAGVKRALDFALSLQTAAVLGAPPTDASARSSGSVREQLRAAGWAGRVPRRSPPPRRYAFRLRQVDADRTARYSAVTESSVEAPHVRALGASYPKPTLGRATVLACNPLGREVARLFNDEVGTGLVYAATLDGSALAPGVYCVLIASESPTAGASSCSA